MFRRALPWLRGREGVARNGRVVIRGEKVVLREKHVKDASDDYAWRTDAELSRLDATRPLSMSYAAFLRYSRDELLYASSSSKRLAIDALDGRHIGNCMYYDISLKRGDVELGIMIGDRAYWDKGYGTDSVEALLTHIFATTSLNRVYLHTLGWNHRACRAFVKSGFREVREVRRDGMDFILMETLRPEWERRRADARESASPPEADERPRPPGCP